MPVSATLLPLHPSPRTSYAALLLCLSCLLPACATRSAVGSSLSDFRLPGYELPDLDSDGRGSSGLPSSPQPPPPETGALEQARRIEAERALETLWSVVGTTNSLGAQWEFRNLLVRAPPRDRELLQRLWIKTETQGLQSLTELERQQLRDIMARLEKLLGTPLDDYAKRRHWKWSRMEYFELHNPQLARALGAEKLRLYQVHHIYPLEGRNEMPTTPLLHGLDRLITVCRRHSLPLKLSPPQAHALRQDEPIFGEPLDPQLAAVYQRLGAAEFGPLALYDSGGGSEGLLPRNEWLRERDTVQFRSSLVFGWEPGFSFYFGTVPRLADSHGLQPVIHIEAMDVLFAVPIASSVDRFFDTYSRYLERMAVDVEYVHTGLPELVFPWSVHELVAADEPLLEQVRAGHFDFLTHNHQGALQWLQQLRDARS